MNGIQLEPTALTSRLSVAKRAEGNEYKKPLHFPSTSFKSVLKKHREISHFIIVSIRGAEFPGCAIVNFIVNGIFVNDMHIGNGSGESRKHRLGNFN